MLGFCRLLGLFDWVRNLISSWIRIGGDNLADWLASEVCWRLPGFLFFGFCYLKKKFLPSGLEI
jgi:hypothetical protein